MSIKELYIEFCASHEVNLFFKPFWLDAAGLPWYVLQAKEGKYEAYWVYHIEQKLGFQFIRNPHLTPYTGMIFCQKETPSQIQQKLLYSFINQLPKVDVCQLDLSCYVDNALVSKPYSSSLKKTNLLLLQNVAETYQAFKPALKRQIKKAQQQITIVEENNIELFYTLHQKSFAKQGKNPSIPLNAFKVHWEACSLHKTGQLLFAKDEEKNIHAALWLVYDHDTAYYLAGGTDAKYYGSGAMSYLMWHAIEKSIHSQKKFYDFEGSMIPGINRFFNNFSPLDYNYLHLEQINSILYKLLK